MSVAWQLALGACWPSFLPSVPLPEQQVLEHITCAHSQQLTDATEMHVRRACLRDVGRMRLCAVAMALAAICSRSSAAY